MIIVAARVISEQLVFIQGGSATPLELVRAMTEHGICNNTRGVRLLHMALEGDAPFAHPEFESTLKLLIFIHSICVLRFELL